jgi:hypothetical protein
VSGSPITVATEVAGDHVVAVEWVWENMEGYQLVGPLVGEGPEPRLLIRVTQMDTCAEVSGG